MGSASVKLDEQRRVPRTPCCPSGSPHPTLTWSATWRVISPDSWTSQHCKLGYLGQIPISTLSNPLIHTTSVIRMIIIKYKQILVKSPGAGGGVRQHCDDNSEETEGGHQALQVLSNHHALQQCLVFDYQESPRQRRRRSVCLRKMKTLQKPQQDSKQFHNNNNNKS